MGSAQSKHKSEQHTITTTLGGPFKVDPLHLEPRGVDIPRPSTSSSQRSESATEAAKRRAQQQVRVLSGPKLISNRSSWRPSAPSPVSEQSSYQSPITAPMSRTVTQKTQMTLDLDSMPLLEFSGHSESESVCSAGTSPNLSLRTSAHRRGEVVAGQARLFQCSPSHSLHASIDMQGHPQKLSTSPVLDHRHSIASRCSAEISPVLSHGGINAGIPPQVPKHRILSGRSIILQGATTEHTKESADGFDFLPAHTFTRRCSMHARYNPDSASAKAEELAEAVADEVIPVGDTDVFLLDGYDQQSPLRVVNSDDRFDASTPLACDRPTDKAVSDSQSELASRPARKKAHFGDTVIPARKFLVPSKAMLAETEEQSRFRPGSPPPSHSQRFGAKDTIRSVRMVYG